MDFRGMRKGTWGMKRKAMLCAAALLLTAVLGTSTTEACTTLIVGRQASEDGSRIMGRSCDAEGLLAVRLVHTPAENRPAPWTFTDTVSKFQITLPAKSCAYMAAPCAEKVPDGDDYKEAAINEHHVCMSATESIYGSAAALKADPLVKNGISEGCMPTVVIPYVTTALEGVERLGSIIDQYGSAEGNAVVFADDKEMWYMEMYTGHQWAAIRFPEDKYAVVANDGMLGTIDVNDTANVRTSKDLVKLAKEQGFLKEEQGKIHLAHTYCVPHRHYSQLRVWAAQRKFTPSRAKDYQVETTYDMMQVPDKKISLADAMELFRYRYEDTGYNANLHPKNRAIGINRTESVHIFWLRDNKPQVMWLAPANPEMSVFLPFYGNMTKFPAAFESNAGEYTRDSAYFKFRSLSALAVQDRAGYGKKVRDSWRETELGLIKGMPAMDVRYLQAGGTSDAANMLCGKVAQSALDQADRLFQQTFTDFMLSTVQDGSSDASAESTAVK